MFLHVLAPKPTRWVRWHRLDRVSVSQAAEPRLSTKALSCWSLGPHVFPETNHPRCTEYILPFLCTVEHIEQSLVRLSWNLYSISMGIISILSTPLLPLREETCQSHRQRKGLIQE